MKPIQLAPLTLSFAVAALAAMAALAATSRRIPAKISANYLQTAPPANCSSLQLADQKQDEDTLRRVERDWLVSELRGDADRVACLIDPEYIEVGIDGKIGTRADIVKGAAKNKGANPTIPTVEWKIIIRGGAATAYAIQQRQDMDGKPVQVAFSDTSVFCDGAWHPYFSTQAVSSKPPKLKE